MSVQMGCLLLCLPSHAALAVLGFFLGTPGLSLSERLLLQATRWAERLAVYMSGVILIRLRETR